MKRRCPHFGIAGTGYFEDGPGLPRIGLDFGDETGIADVIRQCPKCSRYIKIPRKRITVRDLQERRPVARCSCCGPVPLIFTGFY